MEIGFLRLELCIEKFPILLVSKQIVQFLFIVLVAGHDHINKSDVIEFGLFICRQYKFVQSLFLLEPIGLQFPHDFIQPERYCAVGAGNHRFLQTVGCFCSAFVVIDNVLSNPAQHIFIADNYLHARHGGFALGNIFRRSPFVRTDPVVFLNLLGLLLVQENTRQSGIVFDRYGDAVIFRLLHRVLIYDISKYMYGLVDGCSGKAHICGVRQGITQVFGKSVCNFCPYFPGVAFCLYRQFRPEVVLRTVRLVAQTLERSVSNPVDSANFWIVVI